MYFSITHILWPNDVHPPTDVETFISSTSVLLSCCSEVHSSYPYTGRFIMFSVITNIYNKKTKGPTLMELFTSTGRL